MTEKRFQIIDDDLFDNENMEVLMADFEVYGVPRIVDVLNELNDENEQLKTQLQNTSDQRNEFHRAARENANRVGKLEKENEQLKSKLTDCNEAVWSWSKSYNRVYEENEQLKYRIKKLQNELNNCEEDYILEEYL